jgi:hypothetical protein
LRKRKSAELPIEKPFGNFFSAPTLLRVTPRQDARGLSIYLNNNSKKEEIMKFNQPHWFAAILLGSALSLPPAVFAAEKGDMMKDEKAKMMKDEKAKMMKEQKGGKMQSDKSGGMKDDMKEQKSKTKKSAEKMKMDKMDEVKK